MTQKIKNYAKALFISSLSIVTVSCSKDKSAPASEPKAVVNAQSQVNNTQLITEQYPDDFYATGRYQISRKEKAISPSLGITNAWYPNEITPFLQRGQSVYSNNGQYLITMQSSDGNVVLTNRATGAVLWSIKQTGGTYFMFHKDGNLLMHNASSYSWVSDIYVAGRDYQGTKRVYLVLQDDGNFVMEWDGGNFIDVLGASGTGGGVVSSHFGTFKL